jgi:heparin binding hemagglutinin HbhA
MTEQTKTRFPAPLYAAAGAGDLAYQQLRKLPAVLDELAVRVNEFSGQAGTKAAQLRDKAGTADIDKIRDNAAASAIAFATTATERAVAAYTALVARGERVVGTGVIEAAEVVNADMVTTEEPKAVEAAAAATEPKARKRAATSDTTKATTAKGTTK